MSKEDLVRLYSERAISRRVFIRGLVAAGVSVSAASAYARLLGAPNAFAAVRPGGAPGGDLYEFYDFYADFYSEFYPDFYGDFYDLDEFYDFYVDFYDEHPCPPGHERHGRRGRHGRHRHRHPRRGRRA